MVRFPALSTDVSRLRNVQTDPAAHLTSYSAGSGGGDNFLGGDLAEA